MDRRRLGKQRIETLHLLRALHGETKGWANHPAAKMWRGYEAALVFYGLAMCAEWKQRGYQDTRMEKISAYTVYPIIMPPWMGNEAFHSAHRAILLAKDLEYYQQFGWSESPAVRNEKGSYPYIWPA